LLGALIVGGPGDRCGSRNMLRVVGMLYVISALSCALAWNFTSFVLCRFLAGIAIGGSSVLAPVYLAEIAPANRRGALVGLFQVNIVIGILLAHSSNLSGPQRDSPDIQGADCRLLPRHRGAFQGRAVRIFCEHDGAAIHRGFFLDAGDARRDTGTNERCAPYGRAKSLAPQYVTRQKRRAPASGRLKTKKIFNR
jgi:Sugar (and other) transporter